MIARGRLVIFGCWAIAIAYALWFGSHIVGLSLDTPYWDEWDWTPLVLKAHRGWLTFADLWAQHNEHRMLFPQLLMLGLDAAGGWSQVREVLLNVVLAAFAFAIVADFLRRAFTREIAAPVACIAAFAIFSPGPSGNWTWGFQTAWFLIDTMTIATIWFLSRSRLTFGYLAAGAACATVAAYSSAFGLAALAAGAAVIVVRRDAGWMRFAAWCAAGLVIAALYFYHAVKPETTPTAEPLFPGVALFFVSLLGAPVARAGGVAWTFVIGAVACGLACAALAKLRTIARPNAITLAPFYGLMAFAVADAAFTALGRARAGVMFSLTTRYSMPTSLFWLGLVPLVVWYFVANAPEPRNRFASPLLAAFSVLCVFAYAQTFALGMSELDAKRAQIAEGASGIAHFREAPDRLIERIYPTAPRPRAYMALLADIQDGPPAAEPVVTNGRPYVSRLRALGKIEDTGHWLDASGVAEMSGWAALPFVDDRASGTSVLVDGKVVQADFEYGIPRDDIAKAYGEERMRDTGFVVKVTARDFGPGVHEVVLCLQTSARGFCFPVGDPVRFSR